MAASKFCPPKAGQTVPYPNSVLPVQLPGKFQWRRSNSSVSLQGLLHEGFNAVLIWSIASLSSEKVLEKVWEMILWTPLIWCVLSPRSAPHCLKAVTAPQGLMLKTPLCRRHHLGKGWKTWTPPVLPQGTQDTAAGCTTCPRCAMAVWEFGLF